MTNLRRVAVSLVLLVLLQMGQSAPAQSGLTVAPPVLTDPSAGPLGLSGAQIITYNAAQAARDQAFQTAYADWANQNAIIEAQLAGAVDVPTIGAAIKAINTDKANIAAANVTFRTALLTLLTGAQKLTLCQMAGF